MSVRSRVYRERRLPAGRPLAAIIDGLRRNGEQGVWNDTSDLSTMFQDAAGALPVYAPGQGQADPPVGRILDKSGRGNHAYQTTTTSRPTLSARYNMLVSTEQISSAAWSKLNTGTGLLPVVTDAAAISPGGTLTAARIVLNKGSGTTTSDQSAIFQNVQIAAGVVAKRGVWLRTTAAAGSVNVFLDSTGGAGFGAVITVTPDWQYFSVTNDTDSANGRGIRIAVRGGFGTSDSADILAWGFDVRPANDGVGLPPYQRVIDASTYDTAGFPLYLRFDGVDDWLQTASVDFSGTSNIFLAAAMRKLRDAARGLALELGSSAETKVGNFSLEAPSASLQNVAVRASGSSSLNTVRAESVSAPVSVCVSAKLDSSLGVSMRLNSGAWGATAAAFGGSFSNAVIYIGRRAGASIPFNGRLYSLLIRGATTPDTTIAKVERYLNQKAKVF